VILFELLTAKVPFDRDTFPELCALILHGEPTSLDQARPDAPPKLGAVIGRCLEKAPERRFQNVAELVLALVPFAPRRVLPVAERAVSVMEAAGWIAADAGRAPLDATLPEPVVSPFRHSMPSVARTGPALVAATVDPEEEARTANVAPPGGSGRAAALLAGVLVVLAGGAYYGWRVTRSAGVASSVPSIAATAEDAPSPPVPIPASATATAAPSTSAAASPPVASVAPTVQDAGVASVASARRDAGAAAAGRLPRPPPAASDGAPVDRPPVTPGAQHGTDLSAEHCYEALPDGSKRAVPCP